jgi:hypothetical protein
LTPDFAVFIQDRKGPLWRESIAAREEATRKAEELAKTEGVECFVYSFKTFREVARFRPPPPKRRTSSQQRHAPPGGTK